MVQQVTVVTGRNRDNKVTSIFFDKGSTCTMVTRKLVASLQLDSEKKTLIVKSFWHTEAINSEYVVLKLLRTDGTVAQ